MLKPSQFTPNEAWILFRLNDAPISTKQDGDFNVLCLMDAASCYILANEFVPIHEEAIIGHAVQRLVASAKSDAGALPDKILASGELPSSEFSKIIEGFGAEMVVATERELSPFVSEAKKGFRAHIERGGLH
jgi:hypothetical protein